MLYIKDIFYFLMKNKKIYYHLVKNEETLIYKGE